MKNTFSWNRWLGLSAIVLVAAGGCADRNKNGQPDSVATSSEIDKSMGSADEKAANALDKAGETAGDLAKQGGKLVDNAATTGKIKSAIVADKTIDSTAVDVDTNNNVVYLRGTVKNAAQKNLAERIARKNADGVKVVNQLKVSGNTPNTAKKS